MALSRYHVTTAKITSWFRGKELYYINIIPHRMRFGVKRSWKVKGQNHLLLLLLFQFPENLYRLFPDWRVKAQW